jgi:hypothetical protein
VLYELFLWSSIQNQFCHQVSFGLAVPSGNLRLRELRSRVGAIRAKPEALPPKPSLIVSYVFSHKKGGVRGTVGSLLFVYNDKLSRNLGRTLRILSY